MNPVSYQFLDLFAVCLRLLHAFNQFYSSCSDCKIEGHADKNCCGVKLQHK